MGQAYYKGSHYYAPLTSETDFEIEIVFEAEEGYDMHPYGSTYARQDWVVIGDVYSITVNDEEMDEKEFEAKFGKKLADQIIQICSENVEREE